MMNKLRLEKEWNTAGPEAGDLHSIKHAVGG